MKWCDAFSPHQRWFLFGFWVLLGGGGVESPDLPGFGVLSAEGDLLENRRWLARLAPFPAISASPLENRS